MGYRFTTGIPRDIEATAKYVSMRSDTEALRFVMDYKNATRSSVIVVAHDVERYRAMGYEVRCAYLNGNRYTDYGFVFG